jgi:hypothetical protein
MKRKKTGRAPGESEQSGGWLTLKVKVKTDRICGGRAEDVMVGRQQQL